MKESLWDQVSLKQTYGIKNVTLKAAKKFVEVAVLLGRVILTSKQIFSSFVLLLVESFL